MSLYYSFTLLKDCVLIQQIFPVEKEKRCGLATKGDPE